MEPPTGSSFGTRSKFSEGQMKGVAHGSLDKLASGAVIWAVKSPFNFEEFNPIWMSRGWTFLIWSTIWFPGFPGDSHGKEPACQCRRIRDVVQSLGQEDSLQKEMAIHSNILAWRIPWTEEPGGLQSIALPRVGHDWSDCTHTHTHTDFLPVLGKETWRVHAILGLCSLAGAFRDPDMLLPCTALYSWNLSTVQGTQALVLRKYSPQTSISITWQPGRNADS